jgi:phosphatidylglycerol---prolipoprotein diacylglyceryl transferase
MHPLLLSFHIGGNEVVLRAYSTFYVLAWVVALALGTVFARRAGLRWWRALVVFAVALTAGIVGARLLDLIVNWGYYAEDSSRIFSLGFHGFSLYGGLVLAAAVGLALALAFRLDIWRLADSAVPALAAGIVIMRVGCFLNGCCFGTVTALPWRVTFPAGSPAWAQQVATGQTGLSGLAGAVAPVHPTQLYEIIAALVIGGAALTIGGGALVLGGTGVRLASRRDGRRAWFVTSGVPFLVFVLGFTLFRLGDDFLRAKPPSTSAPGWFYPALYLVICILVTAVLVLRLRRREPARRD